MKILIISTSFPINEDGSEAAGSFVKDFTVELSNQGHNVAVIAPITEKTPYNNKEGIDYFWFSVPTLPLSLLSPKKPQNWLPILTTLRKGKKAVDMAVKQFEPDHIFALWALPSGHWARYAKKRYGIPYSIWALGSDIWSLGRIPVIKTYLKKVLQDAHQQFADGYQLAEEVSKISNKSCAFLPSTRQLPVCGLPLTQSKPPYRLCFLGRWHPNKGIDLLLEALSLLEEKDWENIEEVRIAGGGPMEKVVKEQVTALKEKGHPITLYGFRDKLEAAELLIWTDFVMIPSRVESVPVIFSDAIQAMRPVIAMPVGDIPSLIQGNGFLAEEVGISAFTKQIKLSIRENPKHFINSINLTKKKFNLKNIVLNFILSVSKK